MEGGRGRQGAAEGGRGNTVTSERIRCFQRAVPFVTRFDFYLSADILYFFIPIVSFPRGLNIHTVRRIFRLEEKLLSFWL